MKQLFFVFAFFSIYFSFSQNLHKEFLDKTIVELKKESKIDSKDFRAYDLLESFYNEVLQSDNGELTAETSKKIETYIVKDKIPNNHLLVLFLITIGFLENANIKKRITNVELNAKPPENH